MSEPPAARLRVLLVTKGLDIGGLERMVVSLASGLAGNGHHVEVAVVNSRRCRLATELGTAVIEVHWLGGSDRIGLSGAIGLARLIRSRRFDIVHVHGPLPTVFCRLVPGAQPLVSTSHTPLAALRPVTRILWRLTARRDSARIAVSEVVAASIGVPNAVIPHGVSADDVTAAVAMPARSACDEVLAIAVASHRRAKNYPNLLRAVATARRAGARIRLVAVGEGPDLEANRKFAVDLGLRDVVSFELPSPDVLGRIASADMLVVSSDWEGQPMVIAEALAVGTPVVTTSVGQAQALVTPDVGRVVASGDHVALGEAIAELANDGALRASMARAASERTGRWSLSDAVAAHVELYTAIRRDDVRPRP